MITAPHNHPYELPCDPTYLETATARGAFNVGPSAEAPSATLPEVHPFETPATVVITEGWVLKSTIRTL